MPISNKNSEDVIGNNDLRTDGDTVGVNEAKRLTSIESIWNNPNAGDTGCNRQQTYSTSQRQPKYPATYKYDFWQTEVANPAKGDIIKSWDVNTAVVATNKFLERLVSLGLGSGSAIPSGNVYPQPGSTTTFSLVEPSNINQLATQWAAITSVLNTRDSWYDGNNLCARSCQVACQTACQTSCQGCNTSQCHNQKCGSH